MSLQISPEMFAPENISDRVKKSAAALAATLNGISIADIIPAICIHDLFFPRYERPDYDVYPGIYCYDRIKSVLPREEFKIKSGDNLLAAYYYEAKVPRGLAVLAHGFHSGADDYLPLIEAIVNRGYSVLTYDLTGTYSSEGDSIIGMGQALIDLDTVLNYIKCDDKFNSMPLVLIGHSWGGYAVSSALALHKDVKACACIAPMNNGPLHMLGQVSNYTPDTAEFVTPILDAYQHHLFGNYMNYNGVVGINSTSAHVLIAQGVEDKTLRPDVESITAHLDEITNPNVKLHWSVGYQASHTGIWHSDEAEIYANKVRADVEERKKQLGRALSHEELRQLYSTVDHRLFSEVNTELADLIIETFDKGIAN